MDNQKLLNEFFNLVKIDSPSGEEQAVSIYVQKKLDKIGISYKVDEAGNIIARNNVVGKPVLLGAHLDTVEPGRNIKPQMKNGYVTSDGTTILGADNKAPLAAILFALENVPKDKWRSLELVFTVREETTGGVNEIDFTKIKSKRGVIADSVLAVGTIVEAAPYIEDIHITITGKGVHASQPEEGINALVAAAKAISTLKLGHVNKSTIANIGLISGGDATNTVPEKVFLKGEVRSFSKVDFERYRNKIESHFKKVCKELNAKCKVEHIFYGNGYDHNKNSKSIGEVLSMYKKLNIRPNFVRSYGASDANIYCNNDISVVNVGDGVEHAHTIRERISEKSLRTLASFFEEYICDRIEAN